MSFSENVMGMLEEKYDIQEEDKDFVLKSIEQLQQSGFNEDQAYRYAKCWKDVNPELDEQIALDNMKVIFDEVKVFNSGLK